MIRYNPKYENYSQQELESLIESDGDGVDYLMAALLLRRIESAPADVAAEAYVLRRQLHDAHEEIHRLRVLEKQSC